MSSNSQIVTNARLNSAEISDNSYDISDNSNVVNSPNVSNRIKISNILENTNMQNSHLSSISHAISLISPESLEIANLRKENEELRKENEEFRRRICARGGRKRKESPETVDRLFCQFISEKYSSPKTIPDPEVIEILKNIGEPIPETIWSSSSSEQIIESEKEK
jgi:hypothetical protein